MSERFSLLDACERIVPADDWQDWLDAHNTRAPRAPSWIGGASRHEIADHREYVAAIEGARGASSAAIGGIIQSIFASGSWIAWGFNFGGNSALPVAQEPSFIHPSEWRRFDVINFEAGRIASGLSNVGYEGLCCAPLLSRANGRDAETFLIGLSLEDVIDRFVFSDPEIKALYARSRLNGSHESAGDAFTSAIAQGMTIPLASKATIIGAILPIVVPMVTDNAEAIANVLARRLDALAYYLETMPMSWVQDDKEKDSVGLGADFERDMDCLNLSDFSIVSAGKETKPITEIRFAPAPEANALSEDGGKSRGGAPKKYDGYLAALKAEIQSNPEKARGLKTKAAIYREIAARFQSQTQATPRPQRM